MNLVDVNNIDCTKLPKKLYPYTKDILDFFDAQPPIEAIPKDQYEVRLKADMVAILEKLKEQLREMHEDFFETEHFGEAYGVSNSMDVIQQKIDTLKGGRRMNMDYSKAFELLNQDAEKERNKKAEKALHDNLYNKGFRDGLAVIDKIRAEIQNGTHHFLDGEPIIEIKEVLKIIDKYKADREK